MKWLATGLAIFLAIILSTALVVASDVKTYMDLQRRLREKRRMKRGGGG